MNKVNMPRSSLGKRNRTMGFNAERLYAKKFREELGFKKCITARQGSRIHDDSGIDLIFIPFNVQIKSGKQRGLNPSAVLKNMIEKVKENFPKGHETLTKPNIVILNKSVGKGRKRESYDDLVVMTFDDFKKILNTDYEINT